MISSQDNFPPVIATDMRDVIERFAADESNLRRIYSVGESAGSRSRMLDLYRTNLQSLEKIDYRGLTFDGKVDYTLLANYLQRRLSLLDQQGAQEAAMAEMLPFAGAISGLELSRRRMEKVEPEQSAILLDRLEREILTLRNRLGSEIKAPKYLGNAAADAVESLRGSLRSWFNFYNGYDPMFSWWVAEPYQSLDKALVSYRGALKEKIVGVKPDEDSAIFGNPIGREALIDELRFAMIPYSPEEIIAMGEREYQWCLNEMKKASRELGFGDDWHKALEHVKTLHVKPGEQTEMVKELALEAIAYVKQNDMVTVPPLAEQTWKMEMMSPERQRVSPFFLGGQDIIVSYPTNTMEHEQKLMSMRGNNRYFSRATVQHELIPGHHLQWFMNQRNKEYRRLFGTPFWTEGWALWWEMLLWDKGFARTPEERVGMLFWRMHRCVRIVFSLGFHMGQFTPEQCIEMLVDRVGHERANAEGEVRRSFNGSYEPLYQAAYMVGGLQFRSLYRELVSSGKMSTRDFHDRILAENNMPVEMVRHILRNEDPANPFVTKWRFDGP